MSRDLQAAREAAAIAIAACVLGFTSSAIQNQGLFATNRPVRPIERSPAVPSMIHLPEARNLFDSGTAVFIDARHRFEYDLGHIPGALNLPIGEFERERSILDSIPKTRTVVTYCDGVECNSSINLATKLHEEGFRDVKIFFAGWNEWSGQNLPTEGTRP